MFDAIVPPVRLIPVVPPTALTVPLQVLLTFGVAEITRPVGSVSLTATPVNPIPFGFVIFNVSVVLPFKGTVGAAKVLRSTGGAATFRFALDELPVPPSLDVIGPAVFV